MIQFDPQTYGPVFAQLLATNRRRPLDAGWPDRGALAELKKLSIETALAHAKPLDREMAKCCLSGIWLLYDFLDESHTISQGIDTTSGSFWHAIMHRREGDFWNSKYWFRRVGDHPTFELIEHRTNQKWDPLAFVDRCQAALGAKPTERDACLDLQQIEWESLFDVCYGAAIGQ